MEHLEGLEECFANAKTIIFTTFGIDGEKHERPMVNTNNSPYEVMNFNTYKNTRKVEDIKYISDVLIKFPGRIDGEYFEISGRADFEPDAFVQEKWEFWYSEMHPWAKAFFWFPRFIHHSNWAIIKVVPLSVKKLVL
ncbi:MAG: pyridoxamine 5'-phosphate oxidase family protein [Candidatus Bathyarchaeia archaeon]|jgi:general stress protein 26